MQGQRFQRAEEKTKHHWRWRTYASLSTHNFERTGAAHTHAKTILEKNDLRFAGSDGARPAREQSTFSIGPARDAERAHEKVVKTNLDRTVDFLARRFEKCGVRYRRPSNGRWTREPISFAADRVHVYENFGASEARYHNVIIYEHV